MKRSLLICLTLSFMGLTSWAQAAYRIAYNETTAPLVPLLRAVYAEVGITPQFELLPSERAIALTNSGHFDADLSRVDEALKNYPNLVRTSEALKSTELYAYARKGSGLTLTNPAELKQHTVAVIRGSKLAEDYGQTEGLAIYQANSVESLYKMLAAGRFEVVLITSTQLRTQLQPLQQVAERTGPVLARSHSYHVLNRRHRDLIPKLDAVLKAMKRDGRMTRYLEP